MKNNWENISVSILTENESFSKELSSHLNDDHLGNRMKIGSYKDVDECLKNLSEEKDMNVIVFDFDEHKAKQLREDNDVLVHDYTLIHWVPNGKGEDHQFIRSGVKEFVVTDKRPNERISELIKKATRIENVNKQYSTFNYVVAGVLITILILIAIYFAI